MDPTDLVLREYLRVSKDRAGHEGRSPDPQHDENAEAVARHPSWRLHSDPYREPTSVSASRYSESARAEFQRLLADLEDVQTVWPPLIEPAERTKLQSIMASRSEQKTYSWPARHLLGGIAVCGVCGAGTRIGK